MPTIELERGTPYDRLWVRAIKVSPNDPVFRDQFFTMDQVLYEMTNLAGDHQLISMSANTLQILLEAPGYTDMTIRAAAAAKRAVIAADILCAIYLMDKFSLPEPSMNKAVAMVRDYARTTTYGDGSRMDTSITRIRECWQEFKSVAHLWAAARINQVYPYTERQEDLYADSFESYLQVAQSFYHFGVSFIPKRARPIEPILDAKTSWTLPPSIRPKNLHSERQPDRLIKFLESYEA